MALDPDFETRFVKREATDPSTGPYLTGANLVSTVESLVTSINTELATLNATNTTQTTNIQKLAGQVLGDETLPVPAVAVGQDADARLDALETSAATFAVADDVIAIADLKTLVADAADFAAFKTAIAAL